MHRQRAAGGSGSANLENPRNPRPAPRFTPAVNDPEMPSPPPGGSDDGAMWMERVRGGDPRAFAEIVSRYQRTVLNVAYRYLGDRSAAEEISQEVFVRVYAARNRYRALARFDTWLYRIVVNLCANTAERLRRRQLMSIEALVDESGDPVAVVDASARSPDDALSTAETQAWVKAAIAALPEAQRAALLMSRYHDLPVRRIAEVLETSEEAVKSLLFRARENLRRRLAPQLREGARDERGSVSA